MPMADSLDASRARAGASLVPAVALALTVMNAIRPVAVDDPAYLRQAAWWAAHPFAPLGGEAFLYQSLVPAATVASPPVAIAWLALGTAVTHGAGWGLKLWLFPFAWLFAWAVHRLLRTLAPGVAAPWLVAVTLSPAFLPSFGFMLDVPMLALATASLAVFVEASASRARRAVIGAGLLAGLALQAKYTAAPLLVALVACGAWTGRTRSGVLAAGIALSVAAGIEGLLFASAGTSPLLEYVRGHAARDPGGHAPLGTARRLVLVAGTAAPAFLPLGLTALGAPRRLVHGALAAIIAGFALLAFAPASWMRFLDAATGGRIVNFENVAIGWMGPALAAIAILALVRAWKLREDPAAPALPARALVAWLAAESVLAPFVSPSASVRRTLGALLALAFVLARLTRERLAREPARRADVVAAAGAGLLLGCVFWAADVDSALSERRALARALERIAAARSGGEVACVGDHWTSLQDAAARAGLRRVALGRSAMRTGDWLLVPFSVGGRAVRLDSTRLALVDSVPLSPRLPLTTRAAFYDGRVALRRTDPGAIGIRTWRVLADGEVLLPR